MKNSSIRLVLIIAFSIFTIESGIMALLQFLPPLPSWVESVVDASLLVALLSPVLFFFMIRPLLHHIEVSKQAETDMLNTYNELELRVRARIVELEQKNREVSLLAEMSETPWAWSCSILDHFKQFNDNFGHQAGDLLLRELGALLQSQVRGGDVACRYGGEEFTPIMPNASLENILQRLDTLRLAIKKINLKHGSEARVIVTGSTGVAMFPEHGDTGETLLSAADRALCRAKAEGRDRIMVAGMPGHGALPNPTSATVSVPVQKPGTEKIKLQTG